MDKGSNTLRALAEFAGAMDMKEEEVKDGRPSNGCLAAFLRHVDKRAREKAARRNASNSVVPSRVIRISAMARPSGFAMDPQPLQGGMNPLSSSARWGSRLALIQSW